ncbi:unnamed protein product [Soboliphyme baturini]|uniref:VEFS-Box domain-containing protein n=1 Tax=Soboliphyme baturini TaxID=241478 RepID=A0A183ICP1_9BILA|nr:unnamed protein product [Soboliphyme baturini]
MERRNLNSISTAEGRLGRHRWPYTSSDVLNSPDARQFLRACLVYKILSTRQPLFLQRNLLFRCVSEGSVKKLKRRIRKRIDTGSEQVKDHTSQRPSGPPPENANNFIYQCFSSLQILLGTVVDDTGIPMQCFPNACIFHSITTLLEINDVVEVETLIGLGKAAASIHSTDYQAGVLSEYRLMVLGNFRIYRNPSESNLLCPIISIPPDLIFPPEDQNFILNAFLIFRCSMVGQQDRERELGDVVSPSGRTSFVAKLHLVEFNKLVPLENGNYELLMRNDDYFAEPLHLLCTCNLKKLGWHAHQLTTQCMDYSRCPLCKVWCPDLYCLLKHLRLTHSRLLFSLKVNNGRFTIAVKPNAQYDGHFEILPSKVKNRHGRKAVPSKAAVNAMLLHRKYGLISQCFCLPFDYFGGAHSQLFTDLFCAYYAAFIKQRTSGKLLTHSLDEFTEAENKATIKSEDTDTMQSLTHNRPYHHSTTCMPILSAELDIDSEEENNPSWLKESLAQNINGFSDLNDGEKMIMAMWNEHITRYKYVIFVFAYTAGKGWTKSRN